ncbi:MAG: hypothetical protein IPG17_30685 [Sandaracinaceae bacterium]|nr:hypothetical protein [Sandaracinaceae bacterium]
MSTLVSAGSLGAELLALLEDETPLEILCAVPGDLASDYAGRAEARQKPLAALSRSVVGAYRAALLGELASSLDRLPQTQRWERLLHHWMSRLEDRSATIGLGERETAFTRLISRQDKTLLRAGPLEFELDEPRFELTGEAHETARAWCRGRLDRSVDLTPDVLQVLQRSWAGELVSPEDLYLKVLHEYFSSTLGGLDRETEHNPMLEWLTDFQEEAYSRAKTILQRYGGVFLADVVGLGKTFIAMALLRHLKDRYGHHAVVVAPPAVLPAWEDLAREHRVELGLVSIGRLSDLDRYSDREVLVIDESHNFRNVGTARYDLIQRWLRPLGRPPRSKSSCCRRPPRTTTPRTCSISSSFSPTITVACPLKERRSRSGSTPRRGAQRS